MCWYVKRDTRGWELECLSCLEDVSRSVSLERDTRYVLICKERHSRIRIWVSLLLRGRIETLGECLSRERHRERHSIQSVPEKMKLEMLVEIQIEILDGGSSGLFSNEPFEKRPAMTIEDFVLHSDVHFESHLLGNGLYVLICKERDSRMRTWVSLLPRGRIEECLSRERHSICVDK